MLPASWCSSEEPQTMNESTNSTRRRALEWLAAATLTPTVRRAAGAQEASGKKHTILVFTKSSGFEHDTVKRKGDAPALCERILTELGKRHNFKRRFLFLHYRRFD